VSGGSRAIALAGTGMLAGLGYYLVVTGRLTVDTGYGRRIRPLGPFGIEIAAPAETVFDVIAGPYLGRTPRAMSGKIRVLQRGSDMVLAEHYTPLYGGRLTAATLEAVTFDRPRRIGFWLVRGPVPCVAEEFLLTEHDDGTTTMRYSGELGTDFWRVGRWWGDRVAGPWEAAVRSSLAGVRQEAERRARAGTSKPELAG
jgi:Polyketide cyclase / dehydrase and lipid transport